MFDYGLVLSKMKPLTITFVNDGAETTLYFIDGMALRWELMIVMTMDWLRYFDRAVSPSERNDQLTEYSMVSVDTLNRLLIEKVMERPEESNAEKLRSFFRETFRDYEMSRADPVILGW